MKVILCILRLSLLNPFIKFYFEVVHINIKININAFLIFCHFSEVFIALIWLIVPIGNLIFYAILYPFLFLNLILNMEYTHQLAEEHHSQHRKLVHLRNILFP
jgi:uncharacterized paraquat-inducible protein A